MRRRVYTGRAAQDERMRDLAAVAGAFKGFRPAAEALTIVRAVPTRFIQYDHGTRVGGHPTERITLIHGPSGEGKTYFTLGQVGSFLKLDNPALFIDAERTTDRTFALLALGELVNHPVFHYERPTTYEEVVTKVRSWCNAVGDLREKGKLHPDACGLIVVDSIRKLVPKDQWTKILELAKQKGEEKVRDRSAQIKAMMNAAWCDELVPLLEQTGCTMDIIARESADPNADARAKMYGGGYITGGGGALYYDASLDIRVDRAKYVTKDAGEGLRPIVYGERHRITIRKSKVAGKEDKTTLCYFHTSNGNLIPRGFDRARDVLELARKFEIVKGESWLKWRAWKFQGEHAAVKRLTAEPKALDDLEAEVRAKFKNMSPLEVSSDGEIVE